MDITVAKDVPADGCTTAEITVLPHPELCPQGLVFPARRGRKLVDELLANGIAIEHACEKVKPPDDEEEDQLDAAWGLDAQSRLSCCVKVRDHALVIELPMYTKNHAREK